MHEYQRHAAECLLLAEQVADPVSRAKLLAMAQSWSRLADLAERNDRADQPVEWIERQRNPLPRTPPPGR